MVESHDRCSPPQITAGQGQRGTAMLTLLKINRLFPSEVQLDRNGSQTFLECPIDRSKSSDLSNFLILLLSTSFHMAGIN